MASNPTRQRNAAPPAPVAANGHDKPEDGADIVIEGDAAADAGPVVDGAASPAAEEDPGVKALREQLEASNARARDAETALQAERAERGKDQTIIRDSRVAVIEGAITTNESKKADVLRRIREAKEAGDYEAETTATAELAEVTLDLKQARMGKERIEREIEEGPKPGAGPQPGEDPIDGWARQNNIGARSVSWLKEHREYTSDPEKNAELQLAEVRARRAGHAPNTDGYFQALEENLGLRDKPGSDEPDPPRRESNGGVVPAAPVSRAAPSGGGRQVSPVEGITHLGGGKYRVSPEIAEAASIAGIPVKDYVEQALKLQRGSDGQLH